MTSTSDKRKTQVVLDSLKEFKRPPLVSNPENYTQKQRTPFWNRSMPRNDETKLSKRKRNVSQERVKFSGSVAPLDLHLPTAVNAGLRAHEYVEIKDESPWKRFQRVYELKFNEFTTIATRKVSPCEVVIVKDFQILNGTKKLDMLRHIRHENFVAFLESFQFQGRHYAVLEHVSISLAQIAASPPYPTELQLAAIIGQVRLHSDVHNPYSSIQILNGLAYLASKKLTHGTLACSNILLSVQGIVKISKHRSARKLSADSNDSEPRALRRRRPVKR